MRFVESGKRIVSTRSPHRIDGDQAYRSAGRAGRFELARNTTTAMSNAGRFCFDLVAYDVARVCCTLREDLLVEVSKLAREGRFDYLFVKSTGISEPLPVEPRLGRRTVLTFPLLPPPQKN